MLEEKIIKLETKLKKADYSFPKDNQLQSHIDRKLEAMSNKLQQYEALLHKQGKEVIKRGDTKIDGPYDLERMETAINEWTNTIEQQLNVYCMISIDV